MLLPCSTQEAAFVLMETHSATCSTFPSLQRGVGVFVLPKDIFVLPTNWLDSTESLRLLDIYDWWDTMHTKHYFVGSVALPRPNEYSAISDTSATQGS